MSAPLCPACRRAMSLLVQRGVQAHRCGTCGRVWYAPGLVERIVGALPALGGPPALELEPRPELPCPGCGSALEERRAASGSNLLVDVCPRCRGIVLDAGELARLSAVARAHADREKRHRAAEPEGDPQAAYGQAVAAFARAKALGATDFPPTPPGILGALFMVVGLPVDEAHTASRPAYAVWGLIGVLVTVFSAQLVAPDHLVGQALVPADVLAGTAPWTLVTSMFLHAGWFHLGGNAYMLWLFGDNLEARLGPAKLLALYLPCGLAGSLVSVAIDPAGTVPSLGASGAIAGLMGAYVVHFPSSRIYVLPRLPFGRIGVLLRPVALPALVFVLLWIVLQLLGIAAGLRGIGFWAHLGGFAAGVVGGFVTRRPEPS